MHWYRGLTGPGTTPSHKDDIMHDLIVGTTVNCSDNLGSTRREGEERGRSEDVSEGNEERRGSHGKEEGSTVENLLLPSRPYYSSPPASHDDEGSCPKRKEARLVTASFVPTPPNTLLPPQC